MGGELKGIPQTHHCLCLALLDLVVVAEAGVGAAHISERSPESNIAQAVLLHELELLLVCGKRLVYVVKVQLRVAHSAKDEK